MNSIMRLVRHMQFSICAVNFVLTSQLMLPLAGAQELQPAPSYLVDIIATDRHAGGPSQTLTQDDFQIIDGRFPFP